MIDSLAKTSCFILPRGFLPKLEIPSPLLCPAVGIPAHLVQWVSRKDAWAYVSWLLLEASSLLSLLGL